MLLYTAIRIPKQSIKLSIYWLEIVRFWLKALVMPGSKYILFTELNTRQPKTNVFCYYRRIRVPSRVAPLALGIPLTHLNPIELKEVIIPHHSPPDPDRGEGER